MNKENLRYIKNDMWEVLYNKKYLKATLKKKLKELEEERKQAIAEIDKCNFYSLFKAHTEERFNKLKDDLVNREIEQWHNDQSYYLIYKDGSDISITAEEILDGMKFPKMSDIVYAELASADDHIDTERGDLDWYTDEAMQACDYDYDAEDNRKWQYETSIQFMFGTEWSIRYRKNHPEFVPEEI